MAKLCICVICCRVFLQWLEPYCFQKSEPWCVFVLQLLRIGSSVRYGLRYWNYIQYLKVCCWKHLFWIDLRPIVHTNYLFYIKIKRTGRIFMFYQAISEMWRMIFIILIQILHTVFRSKYKITRVFWLKPS